MCDPHTKCVIIVAVAILTATIVAHFVWGSHTIFCSAAAHPDMQAQCRISVLELYASQNIDLNCVPELVYCYIFIEVSNIKAWGGTIWMKSSTKFNSTYSVMLISRTVSDCYVN